MPAVRNFAIYAAVATFINACLQVTVFVSALALDQRRIEVSALSPAPLSRQLLLTTSLDMRPIESTCKLRHFIVWTLKGDQKLNTALPYRFPLITLPSSSRVSSDLDTEDPLLQRIMRNFYAPALMRKPVKYFVIALFGGLFVSSWIGARHIDLGLGQFSHRAVTLDLELTINPQQIKDWHYLLLLTSSITSTLSTAI
jgi:Niemann-Pick C1 protein